ncbi:MAG: glycosyltransferase family 4 protein [Blastocatellia bacterium]|nr:glycosyltransferase family 4 protein [Blastocatellia bacterium]
MKILYYNHTGTVGGPERVLLMTLAGMEPKRFDTKLFCPGDSELEAMALQTGTPVRVTRSLHARFTWRPDRLIHHLKSFVAVIQSFRRQVAEENPDLIHANSIQAGLVATTATLGMSVPVIWHLHGVLPRHPLSSLIRWYAALSLRTFLLAPTRVVIDRFHGPLLAWLGLGADRARVVHNGIELRRFVRDVESGQKIRRDLGIAKETFVVGIVGQIHPRKGQLALIEAFAAAELNASALMIVGAPLFADDAPYLDKLKRRTDELGIADRVHFTGSREDVSAVMQSLDLLVLNSRRESFGLVILEAMACGVPVAAAAVDGVVEIIQHDKTGWLIPPNDKASLVKTLRAFRFNRELRRRLAKTACRLNMPKFTVENYLNGVKDYYRSVNPLPTRTVGMTLAA